MQRSRWGGVARLLRALPWCCLLLLAACRAGSAPPRASPTRGLRIATSTATVPTEAASLPLSAATAQPTASPTPVDTRPAVVVQRGRTDTNAVALTFDAGADRGYAQLILNTLEQNGIHATFGMTGRWAQANPDLLKMMVAEGDELINHTWDHRSWTGLSTHTTPLTRAQRWSELQRTERFVHQLTGATTLPYFRAPFGDENAAVQADAGAIGYRADILWTIDTRGWAGASAGQIIARVAQDASPGAIIIMHVGAQSADGPALQGVIEAVRQKGLGFATISQLVRIPK